MNDILIWKYDNRLVASFYSPAPKLSFNQKSAQIKSSLGDYDFIIYNKKLIGFSFTVTNDDITSMSPLIGMAENVQLDNSSNAMRIILAEYNNDPLDVQCIQASSVVYWTNREPVCIGLSKWTDWGSLGFPLWPLPSALRLTH